MTAGGPRQRRGVLIRACSDDRGLVRFRRAAEIDCLVGRLHPFGIDKRERDAAKSFYKAVFPRGSMPVFRIL